MMIFLSPGPGAPREPRVGEKTSLATHGWKRSVPLLQVVLRMIIFLSPGPGALDQPLRGEKTACTTLSPTPHFLYYKLYYT